LLQNATSEEDAPMPTASLVRPALAALALLSAAPAALAQSAPARENTAALMRQWAEDTAYAYLEAWSSSGRAAANDVRDIYGPRVSFYGRFVDRSGLYAEKRRFARRWPVRRYEHRPGTMTVSCTVQNQACLVRSIIDWRAAAPARGAVSRGSSRFELGIGFAGPKPVVLFERGRVIDRG
jgi:hypothetical protein